LSYHSIENKKEIPPEISKKLPPWLFGCDICQMVCPWNKNTRGNTLPQSFTPQDLVEFLKMSPNDYELRFKDSAILRAKYFNFIRNAILNIVHIDPELSLPAMNHFVDNSDYSDQANLVKNLKIRLEKKPPP
jgi:epoxyqueuosine reductase QueG